MKSPIFSRENNNDITAVGYIARPMFDYLPLKKSPAGNCNRQAAFFIFTTLNVSVSVRHPGEAVSVVNFFHGQVNIAAEDQDRSNPSQP